MFTKKQYIIGAIIGICLLLGVPSVVSRMGDTDKAAAQMQEEVTTWGQEYQAAAQAKATADAQSKQAQDDMRQLACKALSNRIALCQRGQNDYCKQEQSARASMIANFGASFETVCSKDFTKQATAL